MKCQETGVYTTVLPVLPVDSGVPPRRNHSTVDPTAVVKYSCEEVYTVTGLVGEAALSRGVARAVAIWSMLRLVLKLACQCVSAAFRDKRSSCNISLQILRAQADCPCDLRHKLLH